MNEDLPKTQAEIDRAELEKVQLELETQALIRRMNAGNNPMAPVEEPVAEDDGVPTHDIKPEMSPDEVIEKERLGTSETAPIEIEDDGTTLREAVDEAASASQKTGR